MDKNKREVDQAEFLRPFEQRSFADDLKRIGDKLSEVSGRYWRRASSRARGVILNNLDALLGRVPGLT